MTITTSPDARSPMLLVLPSPEAVARQAAAHIADLIRSRRARVLGLATGRTPLRVYELLSAELRAGRLSLAGVTTFNLDEYQGLGPDHQASFRSYMEQHLFRHSDIDPAHWHVPDGMNLDGDAVRSHYEGLIAAAGGIDLQLLGIGANGHIGFNEPGSAFDSRTRIVRLAPETREANSDEFSDGRTPERAITMGIGTILEAREILLLACGAAKAEALAAMIAGPLHPSCPASALRLHPQVTVLCDHEAAAGLRSFTELGSGFTGTA